MHVCITSAPRQSVHLAGVHSTLHAVFSIVVSATSAAAQPAPAATRSLSQLTRPVLQTFASSLPVRCSGGRGGGRGGRGGIDKRGGGRSALLPWSTPSLCGKRHHLGREAAVPIACGSQAVCTGCCSQAGSGAWQPREPVRAARSAEALTFARQAEPNPGSERQPRRKYDRGNSRWSQQQQQQQQQQHTRSHRAVTEDCSTPTTSPLRRHTFDSLLASCAGEVGGLAGVVAVAVVVAA